MDLMTLAARFTADTSQFEKGIKQAQNAMNQGKATAEKLDATLGKLKTAFAGVVSVAAIVKVGQAIKGLADSTAAAADRIDKQSQALGMSRKAFQQWDYILAQSGASIDSLGVSMKTLNSAILNPQEGTTQALTALGISLGDIQNLSQEDQFEAMVRAFQKMPEGAKKSALAMQLFGRQGQALMPLLNSSENSIDELRKSMEKMGFTMSDAMVDAGVKYGDTLDNLKRTFEGLKNIIGYGFMEPLTGIMETITEFFSQQDVQDAVKRFAVNIHDLGNVVLTHVQGFFEWLTQHSTEIGQIVSNITEFVTDISGIVVPALAAYAAFQLITNPIAAIAGAVVLIASNWPAVKEFFTSKVPEWVNQTFGIDLTQIQLPDAAQVAEDVRKWWDGEEGGEGAKQKVAKVLAWFLEVPGAPTGDPVQVIQAWWNEKKAQAEAVIKWALSIPGNPHEAGEELRDMVQKWWQSKVEKLQALLKWVIGIPEMPEVTGPDGIVARIQKWWTDKVVPGLAGTVDFIAGFLGIPSQEEISQKLAEVEAAMNTFLTSGQLPENAPDWIKKPVDAITGIWNGITSAIGTVRDTITNFFTSGELPEGTPDWLKGPLDAIHNAWSAITGVIDTVTTAINNFFDETLTNPQTPEWVRTVLGGIQSAWENITTAVTGLWSAMLDFFSGKITLPEWVDTVLSVIRDYWDWISDSVGAVKSWIDDFFTNVKPTLPAWVQTVLTPIEAAWTAISTAVSGVIDFVNGFFTNAYGDPPWKGAVDGVATAFNTVKEAVEGAIKKVQEFFNNLANGEADGMDGAVPPESGTAVDPLRIDPITGLPIGWTPPEAAGLDYVPRNGFRATLHEGEAVLNKRDADDWRRGGDRGASATEIAQAMLSALEGMAVTMDGNMVGRLTAKTVGRELERSARAGRFAIA